MKSGKNFLKSKVVVKKIVEIADIKKNDVVLEVGPGKGALTEELLKYAKKVIAVEKDERLAEFLKKKFCGCKNLELMQGDILKVQSPKSKVQNYNSKFKTLRNLKKYKIVANIPYYITSRFIRNFLTAENQPVKAVLMVQKEVAERICAKPPKMNMLAISVQSYGEPEIAFKVARKYFSPQPKVDSAVIIIDNISRKFFKKFKESFNSGLNVNINQRSLIYTIKDQNTEKEFFDLVKTGFSHKRKLLINNLAKIKTKKELEMAFKKCEIAPNARAQELNLKDWKYLTIKQSRIG